MSSNFRQSLVSNNGKKIKKFVQIFSLIFFKTWTENEIIYKSDVEHLFVFGTWWWSIVIYNLEEINK